VLGHYGRATRGRRGRFINLRPPTSANRWTPQIQQRLRGRLNFSELDYIGTALLVIRKTGWYRVELAAEGTSLKLNGRTVSTGRIRLRQGVYDAEIHTTTWGGPDRCSPRPNPECPQRDPLTLATGPLEP
jgi:hypothetical protein